MSIEADIILIQRMAEAAAKAIQPHFRSGVSIEQKGDMSPVTAADRAAETAMRDILRRDRPSDGIYGEEFGISRGASGRVWIIDPIDGTRGFIAGRPIYGTLIALVEDGRPILGSITSPATGDSWLGCTVGTPRTTFNGKPVRVRACGSLSQARAGSTHPQAYTPQGHAAFHRVARALADMMFGGDCHNYGLLAAGHLDLVMEECLKPYDWAALVPVIEGAGGIITDWEGKPLTIESEGRVLAAGDRRIHQEVMSRI